MTVDADINFKFTLQGNAKLAQIIFSLGQLLLLIGFIYESLNKGFKKLKTIRNEPLINFCFVTILVAFFIFNIVEDFKNSAN